MYAVSGLKLHHFYMMEKLSASKRGKRISTLSDLNKFGAMLWLLLKTVLGPRLGRGCSFVHANIKIRRKVFEINIRIVIREIV